MHRHDRAKVAAGQRLADLAAGFAAYLVGRGYAKSSVDHHLYLMADLSAWLAGQGLDAGDLAGPAAGRFWDGLRAGGGSLARGTSPKPLLDYLRGIGLLPEQGGGPASAADALLHEYERYLRAECGAGEVTAGHYLRHAHEFLDVAGWPQDGPEFGAGVAALNGAQVLDIVSRQAARHRLPSVGAALTGDRAVLRFLEHSRRTARPLSAAVPRAARQPSPLPAHLDPATAAATAAGPGVPRVGPGACGRGGGRGLVNRGGSLGGGGAVLRARDTEPRSGYPRAAVSAPRPLAGPCRGGGPGRGPPCPRPPAHSARW